MGVPVDVMTSFGLHLTGQEDGEKIFQPITESSMIKQPISGVATKFPALKKVHWEVPRKAKSSVKYTTREMPPG